MASSQTPAALTVAVLVVLAASTTACAHSVRVQTVPVDATVVVNGQDLGPAPVRFVETSGRVEPVTIEARAAGHRTKIVVVHPTSLSTPLVGAGAACGAVACAGLVGASLLLSLAAAPLALGVGLGVPAFVVPLALASALGRQLPDTITVELEPTARAPSPPPAPAASPKGTS